MWHDGLGKDDLIDGHGSLDASGIVLGEPYLGTWSFESSRNFHDSMSDCHAFQFRRRATKKIVSMKEKCPKNRNRGLMTAIAVISRYSGHSTVGQYPYIFHFLGITEMLVVNFLVYHWTPNFRPLAHRWISPRADCGSGSPGLVTPQQSTGAGFQAIQRQEIFQGAGREKAGAEV